MSEARTTLSHQLVIITTTRLPGTNLIFSNTLSEADPHQLLPHRRRWRSSRYSWQVRGDSSGPEARFRAGEDDTHAVHGDAREGGSSRGGP
jgi:hypothetical protein